MTIAVRAAAAALSIACMPAPAHAQAVPGTLIQGDNDALDYWLPTKQRPDGEYTNGLRFSLTRSVAPLWGRLVRGVTGCTGHETAAQRCLTTEFAIAQQMYTPNPVLNDPEMPAPVPGNRPFVGWLHGDVTANIISARRLTSFGLVAGVTGPPSLAEPLQKAFHQLIHQVDPVGWRYQLGFEPAANLSYTDHLRAVLASSGDHDFVDVLPSWSAQAGNARTSAYGEVIARAGYHVAHPWSPAARARAGASDFGVWAYAGFRESLVAYDQTLDRSYTKNGMTFSVQRIPWVSTFEFGIAMRRHSFMLSFGGVRDGKEYRTEFSSHHPYGRVTITIDRH